MPGARMRCLRSAGLTFAGPPPLVGPLNIALDGHSLQSSIGFRLDALRPGSDTVSEHALGNATAAQLLARFDTEIHPQWDPTRTNVVIADVGLIEINDVPLSAADTYTSVLSYAAHVIGTRGWVLFLSTIIHTTEFPELQGERDAYNTLLRNGTSNGYRVADIQTVPELQDASNGTYFTDGIHLTGAGQDAKALKYHQEIEAA
jgi:hypothetical protein